MLNIVSGLAVAEAFEIVEPQCLQHAQHHIGQRGLVGRLQVDAALDRAVGPPGHEERHPLVVVQVRVAHRRAVDQQRPVEQRAVAVRGVLQRFEQIRHQPDVIRVQHREVANLVFLAAVMRRVVKRPFEAALGIDAVRRITTELEREHARDVGREGEHLQIEHQLDVLAERVGHARRRRRQLAQLAAEIARLDDLDAPFDLAHVIQVLGQPRSIGRPQRLLQPPDRRQQPVEDAAILRQPFRAFRLRRPDLEDTEQLVEDDAGIAEHRQRLVGGRPADRVGVDAVVAVAAAAGGVDVLDAQLHRRDCGVLAEPPRVELIERDPTGDVTALRLLRVRLGEERAARSEVIAADLLRREWIRRVDVGVADDGEDVAERRQRAKAGRREIEVAADRGRRPQVLLDADRRAAGRAVHHLDADEARLLRRVDGGRRAPRRDHRLEEGQRDGRAGAFQHRAPRQRLHLRSLRRSAV